MESSATGESLSRMTASLRRRHTTRTTNRISSTTAAPDAAPATTLMGCLEALELGGTEVVDGAGEGTCDIVMPTGGALPLCDCDAVTALRAALGEELWVPDALAANDILSEAEAVDDWL